MQLKWCNYYENHASQQKTHAVNIEHTMFTRHYCITSSLYLLIFYNNACFENSGTARVTGKRGHIPSLHHKIEILDTLHT